MDDISCHVPGQAVNPEVTLLVELRLTWASDSILEQAAALPAACQVTLLHLPSICHDVTIVGLRSALAFTQLTSLKMHLYGACITDSVFAALGRIKGLRQLSFGVVAQVWPLGSGFKMVPQRDDFLGIICVFPRL
jgi:hypothetical protein